jgi:hypothetical protein
VFGGGGGGGVRMEVLCTCRWEEEGEGGSGAAGGGVWGGRRAHGGVVFMQGGEGGPGRDASSGGCKVMKYM